MRVGEAHLVAASDDARRRRSLGRAPAHLVHLAPAAPLPDAPAVGNPSVAAGPWPVDAARAQADAQRVLNSIDFTKRDIVIWVPGAGGHAPDAAFADAFHAAWHDGTASLTHLEYEATSNLRASVATGLATLKIVLAAIAARGAHHRVMLAGQHQGAWLIGEALADPKLRPVVHRAVLFGHPALAKTHWDDGRDPAVLEHNHPSDHTSRSLSGAADAALDGAVALRRRQFWRLGAIGDALAGQLHMVPAMVANALRALPGVRAVLPSPLDYTDRMAGAVEFLRSGSRGHDLQGAPPPTPAVVAARYAAEQPADGRRSRRRRPVGAASAA